MNRLVLVSCAFSMMSMVLPLRAQVIIPASPLDGAVTLSNAQDVNVSGVSAGVELYNQGPNGADNGSGDAGSGGGAGFLTLSNTGNVVIGSNDNKSSAVAGVLFNTVGGHGGNATNTDAKDNAGFGGATAGIDGTNVGSIALNSSQAYHNGAVLLYARSVGGAGGSVSTDKTDSDGFPEFDGGLGRPGGAAGSINLTNTGDLNAGSVSGSTEFNGIRAVAAAGSTGVGQEGTTGAAAGNVTINNSGAISVDWTESGSGTTLYGIYGESRGANGSQTYQKTDTGGSGGSASSVVITNSADINFVYTGGGDARGAAIAALANGGKGGDAATGDDVTGVYSVAGAGGSAAMDGNGSRVVLNGGNISTSGNRLAGVVVLNSGGPGGDGTMNKDYSSAGSGGHAGAATIEVNVSDPLMTISTSGDDAFGLYAESSGGPGGFGTNYDNPFLGIGAAGNGGNGGSAGAVAISYGGSASGQSLHITTNGENAFGIRGFSAGGPGGDGGYIDGSDSTLSVGSTGGAGGNAGTVTIASGNGTGGLIQTAGTNAHGISAISQGGAGGDAGYVESQADSGHTGGAGGSGNMVTVTHSTGATIETDGSEAHGILARSIGQAGGQGGDVQDNLGNSAGDGGSGGSSGSVTVTNQQGARIATLGESSFGIVAQSASGGGGDGGTAENDAGGQGGSGGQGGQTGSVTVHNDGEVLTAGAGSYGIIAQAISGFGGAGGDGSGLFYSGGGTGGSSGMVGTVAIDQSASGRIQTIGAAAHGMHVQSVAGGGGAAGSATFGLVAIGGTASSNPYTANGGTVTINGNGEITTFGESAYGVLAQSIGGGGGDGGSSMGWLSIGGNGGVGGAGGSANLNFTSGGRIATFGDKSHAAIAQSIGGGGGSAGDADSLGFEVAFAIGGGGATAGNGGSAAITMGDHMEIFTGGSNAVGLVVQSIGGGGGAGGSAYATSGGLGFSAAGAVGGNGGAGGAGGTAEVSISYITIGTGGGYTELSNLLPVDSYGIVAQSIGGGGGHGGSAGAKALAAAIPIPDTGTMVSMSASASVGGNGGTGGDADSTTVLLGDQTTLTTQGQGSHGVIAQSIGGGGGTGGDSSTMAATLGYKIDPDFSLSLDAGFGLGGQGGVAGGGGTVDVVVGGTSNTNLTGTAVLTTFGDYSNAVLAQSIGGGGGNAGAGSSNTADRGSTVNASVGIGLGGQGGGGGAGEAVTVGVSENSTITTYGSGSNAVVAQSIAGGGGTSQGGMLAFGSSGSVSGGEDDGDDSTELSGKITVSLGAAGVDGSNAGTVTVNQNGTIQTFGNDSAGIIAQSIAGGGGIGGSAGNDASADNPIDPSTGKRGSNLPSGGTDSFDATLTVDIGGSGGSGGAGQKVTVNHNGSILTSGDWSKGIIAQSIGGGGGKGGTAVGEGQDSTPDLSIALSAGGDGSGGGAGGEVDIALGSTSTIATQGYASIGIFAQSIGGGGGLGADGSGSAAGTDGNPGTISIGADGGGSGGAAGSGSSVTLSGGGAVQTSGEAAHAVLLQSIGGGGGAAGQGATVSGGLGPVNTSIKLNVGGGNGSSGDGGTVTFESTAMTITTAGDNAYGVLAQSIGGGGGLAWLQKGAQMEYSFGGDGANGYGGSVDVTLDADSSIATSGIAAHGILAQSIGGGGGIAGYLLDDNQSYGLVLGKRGSTTGDGGDVTVNVDGKISVAGDGSVGVLAQSVGGGGGILGGTGGITLGTSGTGASGMGGAVGVVVAENATITAPGENSIGIFAQSSGVESGTMINGVTLTIDGTVSGGSGSQGYGFWVDANGSPSGFQQSQVNIGSTGSVSAASGIAIRLMGADGTVVHNSGIIEGSVDADPGQNTIVNSGIVRTQAPLSASGSGYNFLHSTYSSVFQQTESGTIFINADFVNQNSDRITVNNQVDIDGTVTINPVTATPHASVTPFVIASGHGFTGGLSVAESSIYDYDLQFTGSSGAADGTQVVVTLTAADFASPDFSYSPGQLDVANHLQSIWDSGNPGDLAVLFGSLGAAANAGTYGELLDELSPGATLAPGAARLVAIQGFANNALSFPLFEGDTPMLVEQANAWVRTSGRLSSWDAVGGGAGFDFATTTWQVGGQAEVAADWFLGGSLGYEYSWLNSKDSRVSGSGDTALGAVTLKHQREAWLFSAAVYGSAGWSNTQRRVDVAGFPPSTAEGSPSTQSVGALVRGSYTIGGEFLYARPSVTAGTVSVFSGSFNENGAGALDLRYDSTNYTTFVGSPMLEIGGRVNIDETTNLRLYANGGFSWLSNDSYSQNARLAGAPPGAAPMTSTVPIDDFVPRLELGAQLNLNNRISVQLRYEGEYGRSVTAHGGSLGAAWQF